MSKIKFLFEIEKFEFVFFLKRKKVFLKINLLNLLNLFFLFLKFIIIFLFFISLCDDFLL